MATATNKYAHEEHDAHEEHTSLGTYFVIYLLLMVFLFLTVWVAYQPWDKWNLKALSVVVALAIATIKALLVVFYFMHVRHATRLTKIFVVSGFLWLGIMFVFTYSDYLSRSWLPNSSGWSAVPRHQLPNPSPDPNIMPPEYQAVHEQH